MNVIKIKKNCLVRLEYTLTTEDGREVDSSNDGEPLEYICGRGDVISGLERELIGLEMGAIKAFNIRPEDAYGLHNPDLVREIPRAGLPSDQPVKVGQRFNFRSGKSIELCEVKEIRSNVIVADFNHPLAGKVLCADVEVIEIIEDGHELR